MKGYRWLLKAFCFNTQPPEGGWTHPAHLPQAYCLFQHTAARRRLDAKLLACF